MLLYMVAIYLCKYAELSKSHGSRQTFMQQQHESELVLQVSPSRGRAASLRIIQKAQAMPQKSQPEMSVQELELLDEDANIFKLIGPVLIKQDPLEAKTNVKKRLEFIKGESDRLDSQCKKLEDKQHKRQSAVSFCSMAHNKSAC